MESEKHLKKEVRFLLGGPQGNGLETAAQVLTSSYAIKGYRVYSRREYYSNIKGTETGPRPNCNS